MIKRSVVWAVALALAVAGLAVAQETTSGSIQGQVTDAQGASVPGATVTLTSGQGVKTFVTDSNGRFFAPFLTPSMYTVKVELSGFSTVERKNVQVRLGQRMELDLSLKVGDLTEVVEVIGETPIIDTNSTTAGSILESDALQRIPVGRNFTDTLYLVAGVSSSGTVGSSNPSVSGASGLENNYIVDGVNITNAGYGAIGSYSIVFGSLGTGVTTDFIKETQVKTAGFEAEYGQATGGVVNVVTKSGSNTFHGSLFGYFRPSFLEGDWRNLQTPNGTVNTEDTDTRDFGITLGGPIVKDKLFFFGAFNPQFQNRTFLAPDGFPLESLGGVERKRKIYSYAGKITYQAGSNHRFDVSAYGDPSKGDNGPQRTSALLRTTDSAFSELTTYGGHNQVIKYDGILSRNWLIEASVGRSTNNIEELPSVNTWSVNDTTVVPNVLSGGIGFYEQGNEGKNVQYSVKSTNLFEAGGSHQLRYGILYEDIKYDNFNQRTGPTFTAPNGIVTATGANISVLPDPVFGRIYRVVRANYSVNRPTKQKYMSFFLQDTWQIGKKLTLRPGVRYEQQKLIGSDSPPLCNEGDSVPGAGDGPGAAIPCEFQWDGNWGPRLGATYDLFGDGRSKLYVSWGRFYAKIPNDLAARALSADAGVQRADYFDANLTQPVPNGVVAAGLTTHFLEAGLGAAQFDPESKSTYQDEFLTGIEFEAARGFSVGARYVYKNLPRILEDIGTAQFVLYDLGFPGLSSVEYFITNVNANSPTLPNDIGIPQASFEDPSHKYHSVELTANKAFSNNWSFLASYRWSKLSGNFEGFYRNDNGQSDPSITSLFDFPTNDVSYTSIGVPQFGYSGDVRYLGTTLGTGRLPNDRTHQFKVYGNYTFGDLNAGMGLFMSSGTPLTRTAANPNYDSDGEIPEALRGSGIDTIEDGFREKAATEFTFDFHLDYTVRVGGQRLILLADAFNLFNGDEALAYDQNTELGFDQPNPDYGTTKNPGGTIPAYKAPRAVRLGIRFEW